MTKRREPLDWQSATDKLQRCGVAVGADFFTLDTATVESLLAEADRDGYRKPANANGSRGRYYHARLQRAAARNPERAAARNRKSRAATAARLASASATQ